MDQIRQTYVSPTTDTMRFFCLESLAIHPNDVTHLDLWGTFKLAKLLPPSLIRHRLSLPFFRLFLQGQEAVVPR